MWLTYKGEYLDWDGNLSGCGGKLSSDLDACVGTETCDFQAAWNFVFHDSIYYHSRRRTPPSSRRRLVLVHDASSPWVP
jgi:hypothetical protein